MTTSTTVKRKSEMSTDYHAAFLSAARVVRAIKSLDIPTRHKRRYLNCAVWHVTVPRESLKYRTRFISVAAQKVAEQADLLNKWRSQLSKTARTISSLKNPETVLCNFDPLIRKTLEEFAVTEDAAKRNRLLQHLENAANELRAQLRHEHVVSRKDLIDELLRENADIEGVLLQALACTVTSTEHGEKLGSVPKLIRGTDRYRIAGICVIDTETGNPAPWSAP